MKLFFIFVAFTLTGCALSPNEMKTVSIQRLCDEYAAPLSPQFMNPEVASELISRGAAHCTTSEYRQARAAAFQGLGGALQLMQSGQQRTYAPSAPVPSLPQPVRCTTQYNALSKQYQTICN
jgi:hypothetical protein